MSTRFHAAAGLLVLASLFAPFGPFATDAASPDDRSEPNAVLAEMNWLAGSWSGSMWGGDFHAFYSGPGGGKILSHSRLLKEGREVFFEFEVFEPRDGVVYLQPFPGGKKATGFPLASHDPRGRKAIFENPEKDYPTRITYHRVDDDRLVITLDDPHGTSDKVERFELER